MSESKEELQKKKEQCEDRIKRWQTFVDKKERVTKRIATAKKVTGIVVAAAIFATGLIGCILNLMAGKYLPAIGFLALGVALAFLLKTAFTFAVGFFFLKEDANARCEAEMMKTQIKEADKELERLTRKLEKAK